MKQRLLFLVITVALLASCSAATSTATLPAKTNAPATLAATQPSATPNVLGLNIVAAFDPTSQILTIYGTTPGATIVLGGTPLSVPPTATATNTSLPTNTSVPTKAPAQVNVPRPTSPPPAPAVTIDNLRGKIIFKTDRDGGFFPNSFQFYAMNADGSNVQKLDYNSTNTLYGSLQAREGYSPDKSKVVVGELSCYSPPCYLYILDPQMNPALERSQGQWTPSNPVQKSVDPVWSPDSSWVAFVANWENNRTNNIFKGTPNQTPVIFRRLTDFGGQANLRHPTYAPGGGTLAFSTQSEGRWQIWVLDPTAETVGAANPHNLRATESNDWDPLWVK